ncbi:tetratricopeptide repeat protein [Marinitoga aeolica]|uniref:Tetratricopeptide repeat protein n=1 Tax=Marinitoga aeolica TaxID=2809031 RepID=A0ABY8PRK6_9BACT|nr:hypothetical protein [Marinitoga aeolica]WGS65252.1 hypothetical protein JRV97_01445 [Marinitoga aeolica]
MKKYFFIILIMFLIVFSFSVDIADFYVKNFNTDEMINSNKVNIKIFGYLKKYFETGYSGYLRAANELRAKYNELLNFEEKNIFDIMAMINPQTTIDPIKKLEELKNKYPNFQLVNILLLEFEYKQWLITGDPKLAKKILNEIESIKKIMGYTPFVVYYKANFLFKSSIYGNKEEAYTIIKKGVLEFPENKKIMEIYLIIAAQLEKDKKDKNIFEEISKVYVKEPEVKENILLLIAKHFFESNKKDFAKQIIINKIIPNVKNSRVLQLSYELLGDYADTNVQKMNYYQQSLKYNSENARILSKWALSMLKVDENKYKTLARIALNKAISIDPNISTEALKALKNLRTKVKIEVMVNYVLPIILFVSGSLGILIYYEKRKKKKEKELLLKDDEEGEKDD